VVGFQIEIRSGDFSIAAPFGGRIIFKKSSRNEVYRFGQDTSGSENNLIADFYKHGDEHSMLEYLGFHRAITKIFKNTNVKVTFGTNNTIGKLLTTRYEHNQSKYENNGIYQLTCPTCNKKYTGQTGRQFRIRFQEHFRDFKYGNGKSRFAAHLLENKHSIGPMDNITETLHTMGKGRMIDTLEGFYIFQETKINN
jgi:hypothetical protein